MSARLEYMSKFPWVEEKNGATAGQKVVLTEAMFFDLCPAK